MNSSYSKLILRLDNFIRKYYQSKWMLGVLYVFCLGIFLFLLFSSLEYFSYYSKGLRFSLLLVFCIFLSGIFIQFFLFPFLAYLRLGKRINHEKASKIIGDHFPEVSDRLLNALQLYSLSDSHLYDNELINSSIDQKLKSFSLLSFTAAIDQKRNWLFLKALGILLLLGLLIWGLFPTVLTQGTQRILAYKTEFSPPPPFTFMIENRDLSALKNGNFLLRIRIKGNVIPSEIALDNGNIQIPCLRVSATEYSYSFNNLQNDSHFRLYGAGYYSSFFTLKVYPNAEVINFEVKLSYPKYTKKNTEIIKNTGDLIVPEGTRIEWSFNTQACDSVFFFSNQRRLSFIKQSNRYLFSERALTDINYTVIPINSFIKIPDSFQYHVKIIKDNYAEISIGSQDSSLIDKKINFKGEIKDDYGFDRLVFHYVIQESPNLKGADMKSNPRSVPIPIDRTATQASFAMSLNLERFSEDKGKTLSYYFEIFDNDGVHGPKSTRTSPQTLHLNSLKEDLKIKKDLENTIASSLKKATKVAMKLEIDTKTIVEKLRFSDKISFEDYEHIKEVLNDKALLDSSLKNVQKENDEAQKLSLLKESDSSRNFNKSILEKEVQMNNLLKNLVTKETQDLLDKLSKLLNENKLNETKSSLKALNSENKSFSDELKRIEDLYKKLNRDRELQGEIYKIQELSKQERALSLKSAKDKKSDIQGLKAKEKEQQQSFQEIQKTLEALEKTNRKDGINPDFKNPLQLEKEISKSQQEGQEALSKNSREDASKKQENAANSMDELGFSLSKMKQTMEASELKLDLQALRIILENLLRISFKQESLLKDLQDVSPSDPSLLHYIHDQFALKESIGRVQDSLFALARKVPPINSFIRKELSLVNENMAQLTGLLEDRKLYEARSKQQYLMTSINNLAVMLSNVEKQMANTLSRLNGGNNSGNKMSLNSLIFRQKKLGEQMGTTGSGQQNEGEGQDEALVRMAGEQESIRMALEELKKRAGLGAKTKEDLGAIQKEMEKSETDLLYKRIKPENRHQQKEIVTRMLEVEKAEKEQGKDSKLRATNGKDQELGIIKPLVTFFPEKVHSIEVLKTFSPNITPYYKMKIITYFNLLNDRQSRNEKLGTH